VSRLRRSAFTLIELIAVTVIMATLMAAVVPALDSMVPKYRMRAGARNVASVIEQAQAEAVGKRREYVVAYDLDEHRYWLVLPPQDEEEEEGDGGGLFGFGGDDEKGKGQRPKNDVEHGLPPVDPNAVQDAEQNVDVMDRESLTPQELPPGVKFQRVLIGDDEKTSGTVYVPFSHLGNEGTHIVGLELEGDDGNDPLQIFVKFSALSRTISYHDEPPQLRTLGDS
jgi:prepilin-type N-terminal cleavage/methylation domain-containing protein